MPKIKTHSAAKKRFTLTKNGKIKYAHVGRRHILNKKTTKRKRAMRRTGYSNVADMAQIKRLIPYA